MKPVDVGLYCSVGGTFIGFIPIISDTISLSENRILSTYTLHSTTSINNKRWSWPQWMKGKPKEWYSSGWIVKMIINQGSWQFNFEQQARSQEWDSSYWDFVFPWWRSSMRDKQRMTPALWWISSSQYILRYSSWCSLLLQHSQYHCLPLYLHQQVWKSQHRLGYNLQHSSLHSRPAGRGRD